MFNVDEDLCVKLEKINASDLINALLREHFRLENTEKIDILKQKMAENRQKSKEIRQKSREIEREIAEILDKKEKKRAENKSAQEIEVRKKELEILLNKWRKGEITDEQYWSNFD